MAKELNYTKGEWYHLIDTENRHHIMSRGRTGDMEQNVAVMSVRPEAEANVQLIVAAVNACIKLNPGNPMAVAESITDLYEALKGILLVAIPHDKTDWKFDVLGNRLEKAVEALAKAEGK